MFKEKLNDLVNAIQSAPELPAQYEAELASEKELSRAEGFSAGVASVSNPGDKVYSQEDLDAVVNPLKDEIAVVKSELEVVKSESQVKVDEAVKAAKSQLLLDIEADLQAAQDSENATEQEFKMKLEGRKNF